MKIKGRENYKGGTLKDSCGSPCYAIIPILDAIEDYRINDLNIPRSQFTIWEPAIGMDPKSRHPDLLGAFLRLGYSCIGTTEDFFTLNVEQVEKRLGYDLKINMIVTNPPFSVKLKRKFVEKCNQLYNTNGLPFALLMNITTLTEKVNGQTLKGCTTHIPFGRICFDMPDKGWGTPDNPTTATFPTAWFSKGISDPGSIEYNMFDMSNHFKAIEKFDEIVSNQPRWVEE